MIISTKAVGLDDLLVNPLQCSHAVFPSTGEEKRVHPPFYFILISKTDHNSNCIKERKKKPTD